MNTKSAASEYGVIASNSGRCNAVMDYRIGRFGYANLFVKGALRKRALEYKRIRHTDQRPLDQPEGDTGRRARRVVEHPAMRRIECDTLFCPDPRYARVEPTLGAMPVQHIDRELVRERPDPKWRREIADPEYPRDRQGVDSER